MWAIIDRAADRFSGGMGHGMRRRPPAKGSDYRTKPADSDLADQLSLFKKDLLNELRPQKKQSRPFSEVLGRWEKAHALTLSGTSIADHHSTAKKLREAFGDATDISRKQVDDLITEGRARGLSARTVNKWRTSGKLALENGIRDGDWTGPNAFAEARRTKVPQLKRKTMAVEEVLPFVDEWSEKHHPLVMAAILTTARAGELLSWKREDIDTRRWVMRFMRSWDNDFTKNGDQREGLPVHFELIPYLEAQLASHNYEWVFPHPSGSRRPRGWDLAAMTKTALGKAGLVEGYLHRCIRGCKTDPERHADAALRRCDSCGHKLYCNPIPRAITFHGLRRVGGSLYKEAGCNDLVRKLLMGHRVKDITDSAYTVISEEFMRKEINRLTIGPRGADRPFDGPTTIGLLSRGSGVRVSSGAINSLPVNPTAIGLEGKTARRVGLLTAQEVAEELRCHLETVYALITRGQLLALRVGSNYRIKRSDLDAFLSTGGGEQ